MELTDAVRAEAEAQKAYDSWTEAVAVAETERSEAWADLMDAQQAVKKALDNLRAEAMEVIR